MNNKDLYYALIIDSSDEEYNCIEDIKSPLLREAIEYFEEKRKSNMGIGIMMGGYIFTNPDQNKTEEYLKIQKTLDKYIERYAKSKGKTMDDYTLKFINYGRTELVYVLVDDVTNEKVTILIKQPCVETGKVKKEMDYLVTLKKCDPMVVAPIDYYTDGESELYVTPYIEQARCVASDAKWGMYVPEPMYRFEDFDSSQESIVNECMIAKLVSYYDHTTHEGVASCKVGGGDFMLEKGWETRTPTIEDTLSSLYFIACRDKVQCTLDQYLDTLRQEFSRATIEENQDSLIINHRGRVAMRRDDIERGISRGLSMLHHRNERTK